MSYNQKENILVEIDMAILRSYIDSLEKTLERQGLRMICKCCTLACIPIWGKGKEDACEVCDEFEGKK